MKSVLIFLLCAINFGVIAQDQKPLPSDVREVLNTLQGNFNWTMIRPSDNKVLRTGTKTSTYDLDSLILLSHEEFDSSSIKQVAFFGYNRSDSSFVSVGLYNIDMGPHVSSGYFVEDSRRIEFYENDSARYYLNLSSPSRYFWTYENLKNQKWEKRDLKIVFERSDSRKEPKLETITGKLIAASSIEMEEYYHVDVDGTEFVFFNYFPSLGRIDFEWQNTPKQIIVDTGKEFVLNESLRGHKVTIEYEELLRSSMINKYNLEPMVDIDTIRIVRKMSFN
ncbi:MAG: hypothetical protein ABJG78_09845 [Cyclobacteriaceae bacterium]